MPRPTFLVAASLLATALACGSDGGSAPLGTAPSTSPIASPSAPGAASARDEERKRELLLEMGVVEDPPDVVPDAPGPTPSEVNVDALLRGGAVLEGLPVRSTDPGTRFDRFLPGRLGPAPPRQEGAGPPSCNPTDPLCDDF